MSLHLDKTESIDSSKHKLKTHSFLNIHSNGVDISAQEDITLYLGVKIQQDLSEESNSIITKSNARLKYLYRQCRFLSFETTKKTLCNALILCHYDYACAAWYSPLTVVTKNNLQVTQNKVIRFVLNLGPRAHIGYDQFTQVNWLPVKQRVEQIKLLSFPQYS